MNCTQCDRLVWDGGHAINDGECVVTGDEACRKWDALNVAFRYGQIDGAHHRLWVIDQMVRALTGENYHEWVKKYEEDGKYEWDKGIAP